MPEASTYPRLSKEDAVVLLVDHQAGLLSLVQDASPAEFKNNVLHTIFTSGGRAAGQQHRGAGLEAGHSAAKK